MSDRNRIALVTGATRGLGRALSLDFARAGLTAVATGRTAAGLADLEAVADGEGLAVVALRADHTVEEDNRRVVARIAELGGLDVLVHNAGILGPIAAIQDYSEQAWDDVMAINLTAPFRLTKALTPHLRRGASVILLGSGVSRVGRARWGAYCVSKFGVEALGQILAPELGELGVRVNVVDPGSMRTAMRAAARPEEDPMTLITPEENTGIFLWLALHSDAHGQRFEAKVWREANVAQSE